MIATQDFINSLPPKVRSTNDFQNGTKFRYKNKALEHDYIEHNQLYKKYIAIDIDRKESAYLHEDLNLPTPTFIIINRKNTHCHYLWQLRTPVIYTNNGRRKPQRFYENIDLELTRRTQADMNYVGKFVKNPLSKRWLTITNNIEHDLEDFQEYIDLSLNSKKNKLKLNIDNQGRNSTLFNNLRFYAYAVVKNYSCYQSFFADVEARAYEINEQLTQAFSQSLPLKEVLHTVNSIVKYTYRRKNENFNNKGILQLPNNLSQKEKEIIGAKHTHSKRKSKTLEAILSSVEQLKIIGIPITQKSVAIRSTMSLDSVKRYWKEVEPLLPNLIIKK